MANVLVVDWSHWHPLIDGHALAAAGVAGAIGKVSEGSGNQDRTWISGRDRAIAAGIPVGGYHFYRHAYSPQENAQAFLDRYGDPKLCRLPPVLDAEDDKASAVHRSRQSDELLTWLQLVERGTNRTPMVYSGKWWWLANSTTHTGFTRYPLWIAKYPRNDGTPPDRLTRAAPFPPWPRWVMWQFTSRWQVAGMSGECDCSVISDSDLASLIGGHVPTPIPQPTPHPGDDDMTPEQEAKLDKAVVIAQACLDQLRAQGDSAGGDLSGDRRGSYLPRLRQAAADTQAKVNDIYDMLRKLKDSTPPTP